MDNQKVFQYLEVNGDVNIFLSEEASDKFIKKLKTDQKKDQNIPVKETRLSRKPNSLDTRRDSGDEILAQIS